MKVEKNTYTEEDLSQYDHFSSNLKTPIRSDAFDLSDKEKIEIIKKKVTDIIQTLGLDLSDDSIKGTPKRVAEMYVNEIFSGLNPKNKPKASTFENKYKYGEMLVEKNITLVNIICFQSSERRMLDIFQMELWLVYQK